MRKLSCFLLVGILLCSGCSKQKDTTTDTTIPEITQDSLTNINYTFSSEDVDARYDTSSAYAIKLDQEQTDVGNSSATYDNKQLMIRNEGTYILSGQLTDGQVIVDAGDNDIVKLVLDSVQVTSNTSSAIYVKNAKKTMLILPEGSASTLSDASSYTYDDTVNEEPNAAVFSKDDLTITGSGSLTVNGNFNHGIFCKDMLVLTGGNINVTSKNDGVKGKDGVACRNITLQIDAQGDGLRASNTTDESKGWIYLSSGTYDIQAAQDGIQAETALEIVQGAITVKSGDGSEAADMKTDFDMITAQSEESSVSKKGIKGTSIIFYDGTYTIDSEDDAVHANGSIEVKGGTFDINSGDDGIHADETLTISKGTINISYCYEGLEGKEIIMEDGNVDVNAQDDGWNASDVSLNASISRDPNVASSEDAKIIMNGGYAHISAKGDGVDSNGYFTMNGGVLIIEGPSDGANAPLDYDIEGSITGGTFIAAGSQEMIQTPTTSTNQATVCVLFDSTQSSPTTVNITNDDGIVIRYQVDMAFNALIVSSNQLVTGQTYQLSIGGSSDASSAQGISESGSLQNETQLGQFTLSEDVTVIRQDGSESSVQGAHQMNPMQQGGRPHDHW